MNTSTALPRRANTHGISLLEVLLALALTALLLAGVYVALDLSWRYSVAGQDDVERAQVARAVLQEIQRNVRSLVYAFDPKQPQDVTETSERLPKVAPALAVRAGGTSSSDSDFRHSPKKKNKPSLPPLALVGDAQGLLLHIHAVAAPGPDEPYPADRDYSPQRRVLFVAYGHVRSGQFTSSVVQRLSPGGALQEAARRSQDGLLRCEMAEGPVTTADWSVALRNASLLQGRDLQVSEIDLVRFRYFDGRAWLETWDNVAQTTLPQAIEISLHVRGPSRAAKWVAPDVNWEGVQRLVIQLPLSEGPQFKSRFDSNALTLP